MKGKNDTSKRRLLKAAALVSSVAAIGGVGYSLHRGIRYPTLGLEPRPLADQFSLLDGQLTMASSELLRLHKSSQEKHHFRAFSPQPTIELRPNKSASVQLKISNVPQNAELQPSIADALVAEQIDGIHRTVSLNLQRNQAVTLNWRLAKQNQYKFAAIGDSGGDAELQWCLQRAHDLGAEFLLHLGDFNYQRGDYDRAIRLFNESPVACYISIGNHDFHENGMIYPQFLSELGPLNNAFTIGKTRFVNIDTAASLFPYGAGKRGKLMEQLAQENSEVAETVSFTHRPLHDPQPDSTHDIGSIGERDWLISTLNKIQSKTLLSGHIHIYDRSTFMGIDNIIAGQGLGHQDILTRSDYSKMVLAEVGLDGRVDYDTAPLSMPIDLHCHPRSQSARDTLVDANDPATLLWRERLGSACG